MNFETWWEKEGSVMFEGDCSAKVIANAAWQASDRLMEIGMRILNDTSVSEEWKTVVRIEIENQKRVMESLFKI